MNKISEADWKLFRRLRALALERLCERTLREIEAISADTSLSGFSPTVRTSVRALRSMTR